MTKDYILTEIRRMASEAGGNPPGQKRFYSETGIKVTDWLGRYWARWGDALVEAGYQAKVFESAIPQDDLLVSLASFLKELGRFPVKAEVQLKCRQDPRFPSEQTFRRRFGSKRAIAAKLRAYFLERGEQELAELCVLSEKATGEEKEPKADSPSKIEYDFVYLMKFGRYYKIGKTNAVGRREREIAIQLPDKLKLIHCIRTDDATGIETYWHARFEARRKNGEWFELSAQDVAAFKRRKFM